MTREQIKQRIKNIVSDCVFEDADPFTSVQEYNKWENIWIDNLLDDIEAWNDERIKRSLQERYRAYLKQIIGDD